MPANVESMFYYGDVPWHGLGTPVQDAPDSEQALIVAGLNWAVELQAVYTEEGLPIEGYRVTRRVTDGAVLGVVSDQYRPIQNREAFAFADALLGEGARFETAGSLSGGRRVWLTTRLPEEYRVLGDPTTVYLTICNGHDGRHAFQAVISPVRVVCQNTLNLALRQAARSWSIVHVGDPLKRADEARDALQLTAGYMAALQREAERLAGIGLTRDGWNALVDEVLVPRQSDRESDSRSTMREMLRAAMFLPDAQAYALTGWGAVQAVSWVVSHRAPTKRNPERPMTTFLDGDELMRRLLGHFDGEAAAPEPDQVEV
jgi:phage/plasmid-like protein (TIGR03299 family)